MFITTKALVLRSVQYKESSRILTVLTSDHGKLTVSAHGAMRKNSRIAASVQPLAHSEMTLSKARDRYYLTESQVIEQFGRLADDLERFALAGYFAELLESLSDEDSPNPDMLSLGLNALHILCRSGEGARNPELIKAAFELRAMCLSGYAPSLDSCDGCGEPPRGDVHFDLYGGSIYCQGCFNGGENMPLLCAAALSAARYVCSCDGKRLYSFTLEEAALCNFSSVFESYLSAQLEHKFNSLDYYYKIKEPLL